MSAKKSVIILTYQSSEDIDACLDSVIQNTSKDDQIIILDNASIDGTYEQIQSYIAKHPDKASHLSVSRNEKNTGFAAGINQCLKQATGDFVILLNPDTILPKETLDHMMAFAQRDKKIGVVGIRHMNKNSIPLGSFGPRISRLSLLLDRLKLTSIFPWMSPYARYSVLTKHSFFKDKEVGWVSFGCTLLRREVIETVGVLDERFFMYFEDVDYCERAREAGFSVWYLGSLSLIHYGGKSFKRNNRLRRERYLTSMKAYEEKYL